MEPPTLVREGEGEVEGGCPTPPSTYSVSPAITPTVTPVAAVLHAEPSYPLGVRPRRLQYRRLLHDLFSHVLVYHPEWFPKGSELAVIFNMTASTVGVGTLAMPIAAKGYGDAVVSALANSLRCYVVAKGEFDVIAASEDICGPGAFARVGGGAPRRAAGQGDVLTGILATFLAWDKLSRRSGTNGDRTDPMSSLVVGSHVMREAQRLCFANPDLGRGYVASDLLKVIPKAFDTIVTQIGVDECTPFKSARSKV